MKTYYTVEKNVNMLIYLMKQHGVKKIIVSPGTTNITFVASVQNDPFFEIYSAADERSAAYIACGMSAESGEPVALSCTGATASRNYIPALTEAYYRKLPVLAITSSQHFGRIGNLNPQVIDRSVVQKDIALLSVHIPMIHSAEDEWSCNEKINEALLELRHRGGGPVHINLCTNYSRDFSLKELPEYRVIHRIAYSDVIPNIEEQRVGIFIGSHRPLSQSLTEAIDEFCEKYNGVVFCEHDSNYHGKYKALYFLMVSQECHKDSNCQMDLLIDMGEVQGTYLGMYLNATNVWRVNPDGVIRDPRHTLTKIFEMEEEDFFRKLNSMKSSREPMTFFESCKNAMNNLWNNIPELPFSNAWTAQVLSEKLAPNSVLHLAILNTLRNWNFFKIDDSIDCFSNTGGFGIDGVMSSTIGGSLACVSQIHYLIIGDLAFFYDLNSLANRHVNPNLRILLINNGCGIEFKNYSHFAASFHGAEDEFIAACGHYGKKSRNLVKHYAEDLGFAYFSAENKDEFLKVVDVFTAPEVSDKPILFEIFTEPTDESNALYNMTHILVDPPTIKDKTKGMAKSFLGEGTYEKIKKIVKNRGKV